MGKSLSNDLRYRLIRNVQAGLSARAAGRKLDIAASTATRIVRDWRRTGCYEAGKRGGSRPCRLWPIWDYIERLVAAHDDWSEAEYCTRIAQEKNIHVHPTSVGGFIRKMGWRYKKNSFRERTGS